MIEKMITKELIRTQIRCTDWKEAIHEGLEPLRNKGYITESYEEAILKNFEEMGTYMVIAPGVVLSHARPEDGVLKMGLSIMNLEEGINFGHETNDPVHLILSLAASDNTSHLELLRELMGVLMEEDKLNTLKFEEDAERIVALFTNQ